MQQCRSEDRAILGFETRTRVLALQNGELMSQQEDLDIRGTIPTTAQDEQVDHESDKTVETGHQSILVVPDPTVQTDTRNPRSTYPDAFPATGFSGCEVRVDARRRDEMSGRALRC
jgi:hypothetical protein